MTTAESLLSLCRRHTTPADRARAALHLRDWLGCITAARTHQAAAAFAAMAGTSPAGLVATALAAAPHDPERAAFLTVALGNALEMDDLHRASILHAGDVVCPAALAAALHAGASGPLLLDALVTGYEAAIRIGMAAAAGGYAVWYNSGTCGVFGAAMAAATALGLDDGQTLDALAHAGMQAAGLWQCRLEDGVAKQTATAHAARAGITAALLARAGARGPRGIIDGPLGFFAGFYPQANAETVTAGPDRPWLIHEVSFKPWPACRHTHPVIAACLALRKRVEPDAIAAVAIASYAAGLAFCDDPDPSSDHAARFSFQHCAAIALRHGAPSLAHFGSESRASLAPLRARCYVTEDATLTAAFPAQMGAAVTLTLSDGTRLTERCPVAPGDPEAPLAEADIRAKFARNLAHHGALPETVMALDRALDALPDAPALATLSTALATAFGDRP